MVVLTRHKGAREPSAAAEVEYDRTCENVCVTEQLLAELEGVGPHATLAQDGLWEGFYLRQVHDLVLFCENPLRVQGFGTQQTKGGFRAQSKTLVLAFPTEQ
jgi:hypothetical protein